MGLKYLLCFAHPDDETVGAGGTVKRLTGLGHEVKLLTATAGEAGQVKKQGNAANLRGKELAKACEILGIKEFSVLNFPDGGLANSNVWGDLFERLKDEINSWRPDTVITFDHTGWSFHLDHIAVSLATCLAIDRAEHRPKALFFSLFKTPNLVKKYPYFFLEELSATHVVKIDGEVEAKALALRAHGSQRFSFLAELEKGRMNEEYFQLVKASPKGREIVAGSRVFEPVT